MTPRCACDEEYGCRRQTLRIANALLLMLSQFYPPVIGGEERHVISLSEGLVQRGHEVSVATMPHPERAEIEVENGVTVHSLRGIRFSACVGLVQRNRATPRTALSGPGINVPTEPARR